MNNRVLQVVVALGLLTGPTLLAGQGAPRAVIGNLIFDGDTAQGVVTFKGILYAKDPVGALRVPMGPCTRAGTPARRSVPGSRLARRRPAG